MATNGTSNGSTVRNYGTSKSVIDLPNLVDVQLESFARFKNEFLRELFAEISPIQDFTGKNLELHFEVPDNPFDKPKYSEEESLIQDRTFQAPLRVVARLHNKQTSEIKEMVVYMGDFPLMTQQGTFIYNGAERVVVSQLVRSPGVYFSADEDPATGRRRFGAKLIPKRGAWLEFETNNQSIVSVKIDRKRKLPVTTFVRAIAEELGTDEALLEQFADVDTDPDRQYIQSTIGDENSRRDTAHNHDDGLIELYHRLRPGDPATVDNAKSLVDQTFFNIRRYDLGPVGRYKLDKRLRREGGDITRTLRPDDLVDIVREIVRLNVEQGVPDHIDHLGNRRVRGVGELLADQFRVGLLRMERVIKERMSIQDAAEATPSGLINTRPVTAAIKEFFGGSQLSQFMDQANPLSELGHKRRLSAMGPGGLSRERAGFDVRDVHHSHYGRVCPIETPEGPNIGLINTLASYARVNLYGFIETPYRKVRHEIGLKETDALIGRTAAAQVKPEGRTSPIVKAGATITPQTAKALGKVENADDLTVKIRPWVTDELVYMTADEEEKHTIAQANAKLTDSSEFAEPRVSVRRGPLIHEVSVQEVAFVDASPQQIVSVPAAMIPFLEHDDANRALMGANMQRQAVPLVKPTAPLVATGIEERAARDSGHMLLADVTGTVTDVTAKLIEIDQGKSGTKAYRLRKFERSNTATCISQRPIVAIGDKVKQGDVIAESMATDLGMLALGQNILVAFMFWEGGNYEDAIVVSERLVREEVFTSIHIEKYEVEARDTKLGAGGDYARHSQPNRGSAAQSGRHRRRICRRGGEPRRCFGWQDHAQR